MRLLDKISDKCFGGCGRESRSRLGRVARFLAALGLAVLVFCAVPVKGWGQDYVVVDDQTYNVEEKDAVKSEHDLRARIGVDVSKEWGNFTLGVEGELRLKSLADMSHVMDRVNLTLGTSYRFASWFRLGANYTFIARDHEGKNSTGGERYWDLRHRASADFLFTLRTGQWRFSLRERPQFTWRDDSINKLEKNRWDVVLRHRIKIDYEIYNLPLRPYISFEVSNTLNALTDFTRGQYIDKMRAMLGVEWRLSRRSTLDFYYRYDYTFTKDINVKGTVVLITPEIGHHHILGVYYMYSF